MTFVLNLLHKDFSILAADTQANSDGPVTIKSNGMSITITGSTKITGMNKIKIADNKSFALSYAGTVKDHSYSDTICDSLDFEDAYSRIRKHSNDFFDFSARNEFIEGLPQMENHSLLTAYDQEASAFITSMTFFTRFNNSTQICARRVQSRPILCHVGSGSSVFQDAVGLDQINKFISEVEKGNSLEDQIGWFQDAFLSVSQKEESCGKGFNAVFATRTSPQFEAVSPLTPL